jgi:transposase
MSFLTDAEKVQLRVQHKHERDGRTRDRIKAVLLYDKGWTFAQIAEALLLSDDAVRDHISEYEKSKKLKSESGGSLEKLSHEQVKHLEEHLRDHTYLYVKDILAYILAQFGIVYTVPGVRNWLHNHGFSYKKPALVPGKANRALQEKWLKEYEQLRHNLPADETICFTDGVHPTHNAHPAYGWIKKGVRKPLYANTGRKRLNLSGAIDILSHKILVHEDKTLNAESTVQFFQNLEKAYPSMRRIHIFCDNAGYYRNNLVKEYLERSKISLHFLPPYSPNLNPIERLWKWMKERTIYNSYYPEFEDFKQSVLGFFKAVSAVDPLSTLGKDLRRRVRDRFSLVEGMVTA